MWEDSATFSAEIRKNGFVFCFFSVKKNGAKFETETLMIDNEMKNSLLSPEDGHNLNRVVKLFNARRLGAESMKHFVLDGRLEWPKNLANGALSLNNESSNRCEMTMR